MNKASDYTLQLRSNYLNISGDNYPAARSAHNCVLGPDGSTLYLAAGDSGNAGQRFNDVWQAFHAAGSGSHVWKQVQPQADDPDGCCTARSNAAAAATKEWLLLFGGWSSTGLEPLSKLEAFSFSKQTWHTPTPSGSSPSPRGQPAAAVNTSGTAVYFFGGWDGTRRYNDLHKLLLNGQGSDDWVWEAVEPQPAAPKGARAGITFEQQQAALRQQQGSAAPPQQQQQQQQQHAGQQGLQLQVPCERADHVIQCWHYCDDGTWKDLLVVFGGSSSEGLLNDTWLFDVNTSSWTKAYHGGAAPCPRSSCAAAICGDVLLVHGGQTPAGVLQDMHLLNLSTLTWLQVDLGPILQPLCRHSMVVSSSTALIFGGYDGTAATNPILQIDLQPVQQLQRSSLQDLINSMACCGSGGIFEGSGIFLDSNRKSSKTDQLLLGGGGVSTDGGSDQEAGVDKSADGSKLKAVGDVPRAAAVPVPPVVKALSKKVAPPPLKLSDLPNAEEVARMPQWKQVRQLHQAAVVAGCDTYIDPKTGYTVFTAHYLQQRQCCGNKCRHCPHGWANVASSRLKPAAPAAAPPEW